MRTLPAALAVLLLLAPGPAPASERDDALAVIAEAVKAHGGADALAKAQKMTRTSNGVLTTGGKETPFTDELVLDLPDRFRLTLEVGPAGTLRPKIIVVVTRDKGWQQTGGMTTEMGAERLAEQRAEAYVLWLTTLVPLQKDDAFTLAPQPDDKVLGRPAQVIKVGRKDQPDVRLFFDKASHLLVKVQRKAREGGLEFEQEFFFADHKDFDGVKLPTAVVEARSGRKFNELSDVKYKSLGSADESKFGKP